MSQTGLGVPPLKGIQVIEFGQYIAVPAAGQTLADLGAEVIKVEPPRGDAARRAGWSKDDCGPMFAACNRGKRSVVLDLNQTEGRAAALALVSTADVVIQNARPGVMERHGLGAACVRGRRPELIYGTVNGFGSSGDAAVRPGFDIAAQAESGMMSLNGTAGSGPMRVGFAAVDVMASHALSQGIMAALVRRAATGSGATIEVSLIDVAIEAMAYQWAEYGLTGKVPARGGNGQPALAPAADLVNTADGQIVVSAYLDEHFSRLCDVIGRPGLATDARFSSNAQRVLNRSALLAVLSDALKGMTTTEACERLAEVGVVAGAVLGFDQAVDRRSVVEHHLFAEVERPDGGCLRLPGMPWQLDGVRIRGGILPGLGQHTAEVLESVGSPGMAGVSPVNRTHDPSPA